MAQFSTRSGLYKVIFIFNFFIFLAYGLAFSSPYWSVNESINSNSGLWFTVKDVNGSVDICETGFGHGSYAWMEGVRGCWVGGMFFYLIGMIYGTFENCFKKEFSRDLGITGAFILISGLAGGAGVIVFAIKIDDENTEDFRWGFILACIASGIAIINAVVLIATRNLGLEEEKHDPRTAEYVYGHKQPAPYKSVFNNPGFVRDEISPSDPMGYTTGPYNPQPYGQYPMVNGVTRPLATIDNQTNYHSNMAHQRGSYAESADMSNGYTPEMIQAEHSLARNKASNYGRSGDQGRQAQDYYRNGYPSHPHQGSRR